MKVVAIIVAAGSGQRMGQPKMFLNLAGKPLLEWTLRAFEKSSVIDEIILVVNEADIARAQKFKFRKLRRIAPGGSERQQSVFNGLSVLPEDAEIVLVHDGARPLISQQLIGSAVKEAAQFGAVVVGVPVKDTIKKIQGSTLNIVSTLDRRELWAAQTPQAFRKEIIVSAYESGVNLPPATDDAMLVEKMGIQVKMVMGAYSNIKITTPGDLLAAKLMMKKGVKHA